jgi:hypothetical protein
MTRLDTVSRQLEAAYPAENKNELLTISSLPRMSTSTEPGTDQGLGIAGHAADGTRRRRAPHRLPEYREHLLARGGARRKEFAIRLAGRRIAGARRTAARHGRKCCLPPPRRRRPRRRVLGNGTLVHSLALLLAVVGLYGVKSYLVAQRTREIGIRMALGADRGAVMRMVMREGAALAGAGIATGLPLAALLGRTLGGLLYGVRPLDPAVFAAGAAIGSASPP